MTLFKHKKYFISLWIILLFFLSSKLCGVDVALFWTRRKHLGDIFLAMLPPAWSYTAKVFSPLAATVQMSVTGTVLGALAALFVAPICASNLVDNYLFRLIPRILIQTLRSFPALILALIATFIFGLGTFSGTVAISLYTFAIVARLNYEDIENTSLKAFNALLSMGCTKPKAYFAGVFPQISSSYLSNVLYLLETNVRHSAILGYVGAGGIGLILNEKVSWREYDKVGMILFMLFLAVCLIEWFSSYLSSIVRSERKISKQQRITLTAGLAILFLICTITVSPPDYSHTSIKIVRSMLLGIVQPDMAFFIDTGKSGLGYLLLETIAISFTGTVFAAILAAPLAFMSSARFMPKPIAAIFRIIISAVRSIPFLIYGLIFIRVSGPGAFTGALTLAVCSIGLMCKRFTEALEALDLRAYNAMHAMGIPSLLRIRYAVIPQISSAFCSAALYRFDVNIREASILGLVGAGGIGAPLIFSMNHYDWHTAGTIIIGLILLVWVIDVISIKLRKKLNT